MADLWKLHDPFDADDIEWRAQSAGEKSGKPWIKVLAYVTNRAIMERLDDVVGPENWKNTYQPGPAGGVLCGIAIRVVQPDGSVEWAVKHDGAENTDVEPVKGGLSGSMKRAAVMWGVGRYLYNLDEGWGQVSETGRFSAKTKEGKWFKWDPPALPAWALPGGSGSPTRRTRAEREHEDLVAQILDLAKTLGDDETIETPAGNPVLLKKFLREQWSRVTTEPEFARQMWQQLTAERAARAK